jgi:hypothetical protein
MSLAFDDPDADDEFGDVHSSVMDVASRTAIGGRNVSPGFQTFTHDHAKMIASTFKTSMNKSFAIFSGDGMTLVGNAALPNGMAATQPDLSADDKTLVYVVPKAGTISMQGDHHFMSGSLYTSTFDVTTNTMGTPTPLMASGGTDTYYYPSIAPDGSFAMFNAAPDGDAFYNRNASVKLLHLPAQAGATPIDLPNLNVKAGITNSWPRWSPFVQNYKGKHILWVTFSSNRDYGLRLVNTGFDNCYPPESPAYDTPQPLSKQGVGYENCAQPQIWMAAVVVDPDPTLDTGDRSFPAFWLPFQDVTSHNHSAQWVQQVQGTPMPDGGTCGEVGAACGGVSNGCCSDVVCCGGICQQTCIQ